MTGRQAIKLSEIVRHETGEGELRENWMCLTCLQPQVIAKGLTPLCSFPLFVGQEVSPIAYCEASRPLAMYSSFFELCMVAMIGTRNCHIGKSSEMS